MSISLRDVKRESSSSRQRDVIELIFTCDMVIFLPVQSCAVLGCCEVDEGGDDPTEAVRLLEPAEQGEDRVLGKLLWAQQWVALNTRVNTANLQSEKKKKKINT